jgi:RNA methyltransferase, TrmH family
MRWKKLESTSNPEIRQIKRIIMGKKGDFWVIEGKKLIQEAFDSSVPFQSILMTEAAADKTEWLKKLSERNVNAFLVSSRIMKHVSQLETPPGILGIAIRQESQLPLVPKRFGALLFGIRDPGNMGTLVRSAEATGCEFIACSKDCVDPYSFKVVRATAGSIFRVPVSKLSDEKKFLQKAQQAGANIYGLSTHSGDNLFDVRPRTPSILVIGSESTGIPEDISLDQKIHIPMSGKLESLNAAMAATICFYVFSTHWARNP